MNKSRKTEIIIYEDLLTEYNNINAWKADECFPYNTIQLIDKLQLNMLNAIEVVFPGTWGGRYPAYNVFESFLKMYIQNKQQPGYLIKVEHLPFLRNRVRSYKGIIPREIGSNNYLEIEIDLEDSYSLILAVVKVDTSDIDYLLPLLYDSENCFITHTSANLYSTQFLEELFSKHISLSNSVCFNYLSLIQYICKDGDTLLRIGGDGGDVELNLQVFISKQEQSNTVNYLEKILRDTDFL